MPQHFKHGDVIYLRYAGRVSGVAAGFPVRVVEDGHERTILYLAADTAYRRNTRIDIVDWERNGLSNEYTNAVWTRHSVLRIMYPDKPYSVWIMWDSGNGKHRCWYVNIEAPFIRTKSGFETTDYELDAVISPDFEWRWKDEEELAEIVKAGIFTPEFALEIRGMGLDAKARLEARREPFNEPWPEWKPEPGWGPLSMPDDDSAWLE